MWKRTWVFVLIALVISVALATFVSPLASTSPDGLEKVAGDKGFLEKGEGAHAWKFALVPDYVMRGVKNESVATALAGLVGTLLVFGVALGVAKLVSRKPKPGNTPTGPR